MAYKLKKKSLEEIQLSAKKNRERRRRADRLAGGLLREQLQLEDAVEDLCNQLRQPPDPQEN